MAQTMTAEWSSSGSSDDHSFPHGTSPKDAEKLAKPHAKIRAEGKGELGGDFYMTHGMYRATHIAGAYPKLPDVATAAQQFSLNPPKNPTPVSSPWPKPTDISKTLPLKAWKGQFPDDAFKSK